MSTAVAEPPKASGALTELMELPLDLVAPSPTNPRKSFPPDYIAELASSIQTQGQLQAGLSRRMQATPEDVVLAKKAGLKPSFGPGDDFYQVVIGGCRLRSCAVAKKPFRSEIRDMDDRTVKLVQRVENLRRKDLDPLEEAQGFKDLIDDGMSLQEIANEIGDKERSIQYVSARAKLVSMVDDGKELLRREWITTSHAVLIARLDTPDQQRALHACFDEHNQNKKESVMEIAERQHRPLYKGDVPSPHILSEKALRAWIKTNINLELKKATWDLDDAQLFPEAGACTTCEFKRGNNQALFSDIVDGDSKCMKPVCYQEKQQRLVKIKLEEAKAAETPAVKVSEKFSHAAPKETATQFRQNQWVKAKKGSCPSVVLGVFTDGENAGKAEHVCTNVKCKTHKHPGIQASASNNAANYKEQEEKRKELERKREADLNVERQVRFGRAVGVLEKVEKVTDELLHAVAHRFAVSLRGNGSEHLRNLLTHAGVSGKLSEMKVQSKDFAKALVCLLLAENLAPWYEAERGRKEFNETICALGPEFKKMLAQWEVAGKQKPGKPDAKPSKPAKTAAKSKPAKKAAKKKKGKK